jgi:hypothetical protein
VLTILVITMDWLDWALPTFGSVPFTVGVITAAAITPSAVMTDATTAPTKVSQATDICVEAASATGGT